MGIALKKHGHIVPRRDTCTVRTHKPSIRLLDAFKQEFVYQTSEKSIFRSVIGKKNGDGLRMLETFASWIHIRLQLDQLPDGFWLCTPASQIANDGCLKEAPRRPKGGRGSFLEEALGLIIWFLDF